MEYNDYPLLVFSNKNMKMNPDGNQTVPLMVTMMLRRLCGKEGIKIQIMPRVAEEIEKAFDLFANPKEGYNLGIDKIKAEERIITIYECKECKKTVQENEIEVKGNEVYHKLCGNKAEIKIKALKIIEYVLRKRSCIW